MRHLSKSAKINIRLLFILVGVVILLGAGAFVARHVRRSILSARALAAGKDAFEKQDWPTACRDLGEYLSRNPDDVKVLEMYADAQLSVDPIGPRNVSRAIGAYRRLLNLACGNGDIHAKLATLYTAIGNYSEVAYVARARLENAPHDSRAILWLAKALIAQGNQDDARKALLQLVEGWGHEDAGRPELVDACILLSRVAAESDTDAGRSQALEWLNRAVEHDPNSRRALVERARFYRTSPPHKGQTLEAMQEAARTDLDRAAALTGADPRTGLALCVEWLELGQLDRADAELSGWASLDRAAARKHFVDVDDWVVAKFLLATELALGRRDSSRGASIADEVLGSVKQEWHRVRVLAPAVRLYVMAGEVEKARRYLQEYLNILSVIQEPLVSRERIASLRALVARAEDDPYGVIDVLEPVTVPGSSDPLPWRFLAESYSKTDQVHRAIAAAVEYLRLRPHDLDMTLQLAREYIKKRDWNRAYETARLAVSVDPAEIVVRLLLIETSLYAAMERPEADRTARLESLAQELAALRQKYPGRADIRILQAALAANQGRLDLAESELQRTIQECEETLSAEIMLARLHFRARRLPQAVKVCREACLRHPKMSEPWLTLAELQRTAGQRQEARATLQEGLGNLTSSWGKRNLLLRLAIFETVDGDRQAGIDRLRRMAREDMRETYARSLLLRLPEVRADRNAAQKLIDEIRHAQGETGLLWRFHQASLWLSSDGWRAKQREISEALERCITRDPAWSAPALLLSELYEKLGDLPNAKAVCRRALSVNPSATDVADRLVTLLEWQAQFFEAKEVLDQLDADPRFLSARRVQLDLRAGETDGAIEELNLRVADDERDAPSRILLARLIYWRTRDADAALKYLKEAEAIEGAGTITIAATKAAILNAEGRLAEARRMLDDQVRRTNDFRAHFLRAAFLASIGETKLAENEYIHLTTLPESAKGYELLARFYLDSNNPDDAVAALDRGLLAHPDDPSIKRMLMKTLLARQGSGDQQRAVRILEDLEQRLPGDPDLLRVRARLLLQEPGNAPRRQAEQLLERAAQLEPTATGTYLLLVRLAMQRRDYQTARDRAIRAMGRCPMSSDLLLARARAEEALGNLEMAGNLGRLVLRNDPGNAQARRILIDAALRRRDRASLEEALTLVKEALKRDPTDEHLRVSNGLIVGALKKPEDGIASLQAYRQTEEGRTSLAALLALAELYRVQGRTAEYGECLVQASKVSPDDSTVMQQWLIWLGTQSRFEQVTEEISAYHARGTPDPDVTAVAAAVLASSGAEPYLSEARRLYERLLTKAPHLTQARLGLALLLYKIGNVDRAERLYRAVLESEPDNVQALNDLAWILAEARRDYAPALELADRGIRLDPKNRHLRDTRGVILSHIPGRLEDGLREFEQCLELAGQASSDRAKALLRLGETCAKLQKPLAATQYLEEAVQIDRRENVFIARERSEIEIIFADCRRMMED